MLVWRDANRLSKLIKRMYSFLTLRRVSFFLLIRLYENRVYLINTLYLFHIFIYAFFHSSSYTSYHFHMETLFLNYQYYKILFILIISRIIAFYIYNIISINFIYAFLFFANKMQTMFTFIFLIIIKMPRWQRT